VRLKVIEHFRYLGGPSKETRVDFLWYLIEREIVTLAIQRIDDFIEAHEIAD
jgi:hypothetical protein